MDAIEIATLKYVLDVCRTSVSAAEAGRRLHNISRDSRDSERITKFLKTYKLKFPCSSSSDNAQSIIHH